jgi:N-formylglutamate amidohydrolase
MLRLLSCFAIGLMTMPALFGQAAPDLDKYLVMKPGTLPIILSAPHGGKTPIEGVPNREGKGIEKFVTVLDTNTFELTEKTITAIEKTFGGTPYVVMAKFERKQIDPNRPADGAYESDKAKPYYEAYHKFLKDSCEEVRTTWGRGLLIDIHGQAAKADTIFCGTQNLKTVTNLKTRFGQRAITGRKSLLGGLVNRGYGVFPELDADAATKENPSFSGGFIVGNYGSSNGTNIDAIQLEFGGDQRAKKSLDQSAKDLAEALKDFADEYLPNEKLPAKKDTTR